MSDCGDVGLTGAKGKGEEARWFEAEVRMLRVVGEEKKEVEDVRGAVVVVKHAARDVVAARRNADRDPTVRCLSVCAAV